MGMSNAGIYESMNTIHRLLFFCAVLVISVSTSSVAMSQSDMDIEYAEQMPLAIDSLLLDITRSGDGYVAVGERGHVMTSTDGIQWVQAEHVPTRSTLTTVFSLGKRLWAAGHDAVIITSGDSGKTWTLQNYEPERQQAVMDIKFADQNNGMAIGSYGLYLLTEDGGKTWEDDSVDPDNEFHLNALVRLDDSRMMIAGEAGLSYRSEDAGESWQGLELPYQGSMWGAIKTNNDCVVFFGLRGHAMESCDFGDSWTELKTGTLSSISGAAMNDDTLLLVANSGTVLTRQNGGPFVIHPHSSGVDFAAVTITKEGGFLLVGEDGVHQFPESNPEGDQND